MYLVEIVELVVHVEGERDVLRDREVELFVRNWEIRTMQTRPSVALATWQGESVWSQPSYTITWSYAYSKEQERNPTLLAALKEKMAATRDKTAMIAKEMIKLPRLHFK